MIRALPGALVLAALPAFAAEPAKIPTVEELFRPAAIRDMALSRDGLRLAVVGRFADERDVVAIIDTTRLGDPAGIRKFTIGRAGVHTPLWVMWANDTRLLIAQRVGVEGAYLVAGRQIQAIDIDGENPVTLFADAPIGARFGLNLSRVVDITPEDPGHIVMAAWNRDSTDLFQVNVDTGSAALIAYGRYNTIGWETEDGRPALRYDVNRRGTELSVYGRDADDPNDWSRITKFRLEEVAREWEYAGNAPGVGRIFVRARRDGSDTRNIYEYDLRTRSAGEIVAQVPGFDMERAFAIDGEYAGAAYVADTATYVLKDARLQGHWSAVRGYFKGLTNVHIVDIDRDRSRMLLLVDGPRAPGDFYLYDFAERNLDFIASKRPWLDPDGLATIEVLRSPMRDGTSITSYLTRPIGGTGALPLVVVPHGGPEMRDAIGFDPQAQALAAQGWLVLQPNFRGSDGYGRTFAEAGFRQWAKRMQDDITDSVLDLVARGVADPKRIAIFGASYGGYAALMGTIVTPDLYRAAISRAGPGNLAEMLDFVRREDGADSATYQYWLKSIGDPKLDRLAINAASPELRAGEIAVPVLLMHGAADDIVPVRQSVDMKKALERAGKRVQYLEFEGQPHSRWRTEDEIRQTEKAIAFLKPILQP